MILKKMRRCFKYKIYIQFVYKYFVIFSKKYIQNFCLRESLKSHFYCWYYMGLNWRIGIDYQEKTTLLNNGPFKKIRHPIYTLSMLLMLGTCLVLQTNLAIILLCAHLFLFSLEAIREEQHMIQKHPLEYVNYIKQTGRFFPKLFTK